MTIGSLFAGIGGFDLGFERAGHETIWQVEIDKTCNKVLAKHFPNAKHYEDVKETHDLPAVDLVCGGFPCQDLSVAGKRTGLAGARSGLWHEFHRVLSEVRPQFAVVENVPGLLSSNGGRDFATVVSGLVELGYRVAWRVLDAQYFGVPQRRRRVFVVASLGDERCVEILFEPESVRGDPPPCRETREDVACTLAKRPHGDRGERSNLVTHALTSQGSDAGEDGTGRGTPLVVTPIHSDAVRDGINRTPGPDAEGRVRRRDAGVGISDEGEPSFTLNATQPHIVAIHDARGNGDGETCPTLTGDHANRVSDYSPVLTVAAPLTSGSHPNSNSPGRRREDDENLVAVPSPLGEGQGEGVKR